MNEIDEKVRYYIDECNYIIQQIEILYKELYTPVGFYKLFEAGLFPVPYLWSERDKFSKAASMKTKYINGGISLVDDVGNIIDSRKRIELIRTQLYRIKQ
jgi:hypothetical protein